MAITQTNDSALPRTSQENCSHSGQTGPAPDPYSAGPTNQTSPSQLLHSHRLNRIVPSGVIICAKYSLPSTALPMKWSTGCPQDFKTVQAACGGSLLLSQLWGGRITLWPAWANTQDPIRKTTKAKKGWEHGSNGTVPA
jgi:hypothetical protein